MDLQELHRQAENLRARGRLEPAARAYESILERDPGDRRAQRFVGCFRHLPGGPDARDPGLQMAPFAVVRDFLPVAERNEAFRRLVAAEDLFHAGRVVHREPSNPAREIGGVDTTVRDSRAAPGLEHLISADWVERFQEAVARCWRSTAGVLGVPHFEIGTFETQPTAYGDGGFFRRHHDLHARTARRITVLYQMHRQPRPFGGGDLMLFDTEVTALQEGVRPTESALCTRLAVRDNQLVLFPSDFIHSVSRIRSPSREFADSRFTITVWLHPTIP